MSFHLEYFLHHLRRVLAKTDNSRTDADLLTRFLREQDEEAFASLVARHGPMVLGVCRRVLGDAHAAEDVFQATFLVLARKAAAVRPMDRLAAWLFGVARHLAWKTLRADSRRRRRESGTEADVRAPADPREEASTAELLRVLDDEIHQLPEQYRLPMILCSLEGKTQEEAARQLGWSAGSVRGRLERGRARLHARLARRGLVPAAVLAALEVSRLNAFPLPAPLMETTVRAAVLFAVGAPTLPAGVLPRVLELTNTGLRSVPLPWHSVTILATSLLVAGTGAATLGLLYGPHKVGPPVAARAQENPNPAEPTPVRKDLLGDPLPPGAVARFGTGRLRHGSPVRSVHFLPDGKTLRTDGMHDGVRIWDVKTGKPLDATHLDFDFVSSYAFTADGQLGAAEVNGVGIVIWDVAKGTEVRRIRPAGGPLAFSPDGRLLAGGDRLWQVATGRQLRTLPNSAKLRQVLFSPDGKMLAAAEQGKGVRRWDIASGQELPRLEQPGELEGIAFSRDGRILAAASAQAVRLHEAASGKVLRTIEPAGGPVAFSEDGKILATGGSPIRLWDVATGEALRSIDKGSALARSGSYDFAQTLALSPNGKTVAAGDLRGVVHLWDTATGRELFPPEQGHLGYVRSVDLSPDGKIALTAGQDSSLRLWETATGREVRFFPLDVKDGGTAALTPDGKRLVVAGADGILRLRDARTGREIRRFSSLKPGQAVGGQPVSMALSADGKRLVSGERWGNGVTVWELDTGKQLHRFEDTGAKNVDAVALSADGKHLAASITPKEGRRSWPILLWEPAKGGQPRRLAGHGEGGALPGGSVIRLTFSPDGKLLASAGIDSTVRLWEVATGRELQRFQESEQPHGVWSVAFSPDGKLLASGRSNGTIPLREVATGQTVRTLRGHHGLVLSLKFSKDGRLLVSSSGDGTALVWDADAIRKGAR